MLSVRLLPQTDLNLTHCAERTNAFTACSSLGMITPAALEFPTWRTTNAGDSVRFHCVRALSYQLKQSSQLTNCSDEPAVRLLTPRTARHSEREQALPWLTPDVG